jgi:hypothetical protein
MTSGAQPCIPAAPAGAEDARTSLRTIAGRQPVAGDLLRAAGPAEPAQVRRDHPETAGHQDRHLVAPQPRGIGETVQEQHRDAGAVLLDVQGHAVDLDEPPRIRVHARPRNTPAHHGPGSGTAPRPATTSPGKVKDPS